MGFVVSPDSSQSVKSDLYTHLSSLPDPAEERTWSKPEMKILSPMDTFIVNDFVAVLDGVHRGKPLADEDDSLVAIDEHMGGQRRSVKTLSGGETFLLSLAFVYLFRIKDRLGFTEMYAEYSQLLFFVGAVFLIYSGVVLYFRNLKRRAK